MPNYPLRNETVDNIISVTLLDCVNLLYIAFILCLHKDIPYLLFTGIHLFVMCVRVRGVWVCGALMNQFVEINDNTRKMSGRGEQSHGME